MSLIDILLTVGASVGVTTFLTNKTTTKRTNELLETISNTQENPTMDYHKQNELHHRLYLLEELAYQNSATFVSNESIQISIRPTTAGISYEFHYLNRPVPFLKLFYDHLYKKVEATYIHAPLLKDPVGTERVIHLLRNNILRQQPVPKTYEPQRVEPLMPTSSVVFSPKESDPVYAKAKEVIEYGRHVSGLMETNDVETKHFLEEKTVHNVERLLQAYEPLKEETKKQCQEKMMAALERMSHEINKRETKVEDKKVQELEHALHSVESIYQEEAR